MKKLILLLIFVFGIVSFYSVSSLRFGEDKVNKYIANNVYWEGNINVLNANAELSNLTVDLSQDIPLFNAHLTGQWSNRSFVVALKGQWIPDLKDDGLYLTDVKLNSVTLLDVQIQDIDRSIGDEIKRFAVASMPGFLREYGPEASNLVTGLMSDHQKSQLESRLLSVLNPLLRSYMEKEPLLKRERLTRINGFIFGRIKDITFENNMFIVKYKLI